MDIFTIALLIWMGILSIVVIVFEVKTKLHFDTYDYDIRRLSTKLQAIRRRVNESDK
jgi:hypothetical protein